MGGIKEDNYSSYKKEEFVNAFENIIKLDLTLQNFKLFELLLNGIVSEKL